LYGASNGELIDPSNPDCDLVIIARCCWGNVVYFIDSNKIKRIKEGTKLVDIDIDECDLNNIRNKIKEYINSNNIEIKKEDDIDFNKFVIPLIRKTYPSMVDMASIQPMSNF